MPTTSGAGPSSRRSRRMCSDAGGVTLGDGTRGRYRCPVPSDDATAPTDGSGRLPTDARPTRYDLRLAPDLAASTFRGDVVVTLDVERGTDVLVCNAAELAVGGAWVDVDRSGGRRVGKGGGSTWRTGWG